MTGVQTCALPIYASSNLTTIKFLQRVTKDWNGAVLGNEYMHMRCCAQILNLIVGEGLKEIDTSVAKVREAVRNVKSSPNRSQTFRSFMERLGMESKNLPSLDVPTRWNSTYIMFVRLNLINHFIGFIPCQICLYFSI